MELLNEDEPAHIGSLVRFRPMRFSTRIGIILSCDNGVYTVFIESFKLRDD